ncbi:MAG TPA: cyclase family protein [Chloroflexota bacterium]|nr:cyclase family protein [Chloroflexota bacterium]
MERVHRYVDLSLPIYTGAPSFPGDPPCEVRLCRTINSIGYNLSQLSFGSHQGTHLDAPFHFVEAGLTVDRLALDSWIGPAHVLDFAASAPGRVLSLADFAGFDDLVRPGARLLLRFDWDRLYPEPSYYERCPELSLEVAEWLAARQIALIGMDTPTPSLALWKEVHLALLNAGVVIVEGLAHLDQLPSREFLFLATPLQGGDGSPVRAVGILDACRVDSY